MRTPTDKDLEAFDKACLLDRHLAVVNHIVGILCELVRPEDTMCAGCIWDTVVKPLITPYVGFNRGLPLREAQPYKPGGEVEMKSLLDWLNESDEKRVPATTDEEKWLRRQSTWESFTTVILHRLDEADPANGHGIAKGCAAHSDT